MTNWTELKRLAESRKEAGWRSMDSVELETILALIAENERLTRELSFTEQWYAVRMERLGDLGKDNGIWPEMAAIIANGTADHHEPPTYAQQMVRARYRAKEAEKERDQLRAEVEELKESLRQISNEVDCNMRPLIRDLVNRACGLENGANPNDLYGDCEKIDEIIESALVLRA